MHIIKEAWYASRGHDPGYSIGLRVIERLPKISRLTRTPRISFSRRLAGITAGVQDMYAALPPTCTEDRAKAVLDSALVQLRYLLSNPVAHGAWSLT